MEKRMISKKGCRIMMAAAAVLAVTAAFITYQVGAVYDTEPLPLDLAVQKAFFSLRSQILNPIVILITHLSDTVTIIAFCAILLVMPNRKQYGVPLSLAALGGLAFYKPMKHIFLRARPDTALHLVTQGGYSFPSGHSVTSAISLIRFSRMVFWPMYRPRPCSALSSNRELHHAGPWPLSLLTVYGEMEAVPPQMEEQPVALEMYIFSPNS